MITNFDTKNHNENNDIFDLHRVNLETNKILSQLISNVNPFEQYLVLNKSKSSFIWSFKSFDMPPYQYEQRRYLMIALYSMLYSLPGYVIIRQGDELEYTNHLNVPQTFRWNDLESHSGFSLTIQQNLWWFPVRVNRVPVIEDGFDLTFVNSNDLTLINLLRFLNQNIKYKLISDCFNFNLTNSLFKMSRIMLNSKKEVLFLLNFSRDELQLSKYIGNPYGNNNNTVTKRLQVTNLYDSTHVLNHYQEITNSTLYFIKSNQYLIIEVETY